MELEVLKGIGEGLTTAEIAERIHRAVKTVEWRRAELGQKLGASNRVHLARIAIRFGLAALPWPDPQIDLGEPMRPRTQQPVDTDDDNGE